MELHPSTAFAKASIWAGVVPQQPPKMKLHLYLKTLFKAVNHSGCIG